MGLGLGFRVRISANRAAGVRGVTLYDPAASGQLLWRPLREVDLVRARARVGNLP